MSQIFEGVKNVYKGSTDAGKGVSGIGQGATGLLSEGFKISKKAFDLVGKLLGGARRSKRLAMKAPVQYFSPSRKSSPRRSRHAATIPRSAKRPRD